MNALDKCWKNQMSMSRWVAKNYHKHLSVSSAKNVWLRKHNITDLYNSCFFCQYGKDHADYYACTSCPGRLVDPTFRCASSNYSYMRNPKEFYNRLRFLYNIYKKG